MVSAKALKLDMSFRPIEVIDAVEALVLCLVGKAQAVETHMLEINSVNNSFKLPSVIALKRIVKFHFKTMACKRHNIIWRDQNQCQYCGKTRELTLDHLIPRSKGGKFVWTNLVTACLSCNAKKGDKLISETDLVLNKTPIKPSFIMFLKKLSHKQIHEWEPFLGPIARNGHK